MGVGTSVFLIALGAILDFGVNVSTPGLNLHAVGLIVLLIGIIGLVASLFYWNSWGGVGGFHRSAGVPVGTARRTRTTTVYDDAAVPVRGRTVYDAPSRRRTTVYEEDAAPPVAQVRRHVVEEDIV